MATREQTRRFRERDSKKLVQVRLSPEAVACLDNLVSQREASGRAEVLESLLTGTTTNPRTLAVDGLGLLRGYFTRTGQTEVSGTDGGGGVIAAWFRPGRTRA